jgi:hypothetical protein
MKNFNIILNNNKGHVLTAHVEYFYPDHFIVEIQHLKLILKIICNADGIWECERPDEQHSNLVNDICGQINVRLSKIEG